MDVRETKAPAQEYAYERQQLTATHGDARRSLLDDAATWPGCCPTIDVLSADEWARVVAEALRACGLLVERRGLGTAVHLLNVPRPPVAGLAGH